MAQTISMLAEPDHRADLHFLRVPGEMGRLIAAYDWQATPLGDLRQWPQSLRTAINLMLNSTQPMWIGWGPDITFLYNDAYIDVLSLAKHPRALGLPAREVWPELWDYCGPLADRVFTHGEACMVEKAQFFMSRGGWREETWYAFTYSPIVDEDGAIGGLFCPCVDVTTANLHTRRLTTLSDLAATTLRQDNVVSACAAAAAVLGENPADIPFALLYLFDPATGSARLEQAVHVEGGSELAPLLVELEAGRRPHAGCPWPFAQVYEQGATVALAIGALPGLPLGLAGQRVHQCLALPLSMPGYEQPIGMLVAGVSPARPLDGAYRSFFELVTGQAAAAVQKAMADEERQRRAEALAELDRAKTAFFSNISHEFRTPLTLMLAPIEDALADPVQRLAPPQRARLELAQRNALRLQKLVNTLLDFSRVQAGRMQASYRRVDLCALTRDLASGFRSIMESAGLALHVRCETLQAETWVDVAMWEKIVLNLLSNAFKFTFDGSVTVELGQRGQEAVLRIRDTGVGIDGPQQARLFERFHRVEGARARTFEGSGIGLALVRDLVELHQGRIAVESAPDHGSCFTIALPLGSAHLPGQQLVDEDAAQHPPTRALEAYTAEARRWLPGEEEAPVCDSHAMHNDAPAHAPLAAGAARILIVDDNADMRGYLARLLRQHWQVHSVADGREALAAARSQRPDLILSDVMMPQLDGFGLIQILRADQALHDVPVMLLSARAGEEARIEGMNAGADDYLVKPFSARELLTRVESQLLRGRQRAGERAEAERLAQARREAEIASRAKDEFLAMLSHELRNPLSPILSATQLMRLKGVPNIEKELAVIERQSQHLVGLVDDLLDVARITQGKIELRCERCELSVLITRALETVAALVQERRHQLVLNVPPRGLAVNADPLRLTQVLTNLLTNAVKYTNNGGRIEVCAVAEQGWAVVRISDNGIGIAPDMLSRLFGKFVQERQALDRSRGGLGLGLAIVHSFVELHGGSIEARSAGLDQGSLFELRLPLLPA
ncbi:PAS domain-containing sensor histidine kinase [Massilia sp. BJB1822]|uniref:PAS domain-containing sensor histidine kinase n=1 Tax=Massilia sp. BJB1822 TaxID=2744470 RepID=UPI0015932495|nr:PAS domain-containing sensor histidine kinase [Massilia sp. BJB1822]NVD98704.1 response regulator [Massilia sp. BJB1822]